MFVRKAPWTVNLARFFWRLTQPKFTAGAVGVLLNADREVLLVEHVFHPYVPWGLPGGWVDRNENPSQTVERELREELQVAVRVGPILLAELGYGNHLDMAYLCSPMGAVGQLSSELLDYRWCSVDDLPHLQPFHYRAIVQAVEFLKLETDK